MVNFFLTTFYQKSAAAAVWTSTLLLPLLLPLLLQLLLQLKPAQAI